MLFNDWEAQYRADPHGRPFIRDLERDPTARPPYWWADESESAGFKLRRGSKIFVPDALIVPVIEAIHSYSHASVDKTVELFSKGFEQASHIATQLKKLVGDTIEHCQLCAATKARRGRHPDSRGQARF